MAILDIEEAATYLKMCRRSLETLVREGKVPGTQLSGKWIFSEKQLTEYVETLSRKNTVVNVKNTSAEPKPPQKGRHRNAGYDFSNQ